MATAKQRFEKQYQQILKDRAKIAYGRLSKRTTVDAHKLFTIAALQELKRQGKSIEFYNNLKRQNETSKASDLIKADREFKKKFPTADTKGVTFRKLLQKTNGDTKTRSRSQIKGGFLSGIRGPLVTIMTDKSEDSKWKHSHHRTVIDLKSLAREREAPSKDGSYKANARRAVNGSVGVYCDCEDFQYRRNYWVHRVNADISSAFEIESKRGFLGFGKKRAVNINPHENAFPKITHPKGDKGPLCIHLIKAKEILERPLTVARIAGEMKKAISSTGPGTEDVHLIEEIDAAEKKYGKEAVKNATQSVLKEKTDSSFKRFTKAVTSFKSSFKTMLSKERKANKAMILELLRVGQSVEKVAKLSGRPVKEVEDFAKEIKKKD